jgi:hypothetical protein
MKKVLFAILPVIAAMLTACPDPKPVPAVPLGVFPDITFASDLETLPAGGGNVTLSWTVQNATKVSIDGGVGIVPMAGLKTMKLTSSKTYTLTAQGSSGPSTQSVSVKVAETPVVTPPAPAAPRVSANLIQNPGAEGSTGSDDGYFTSSIPKWIRDTTTGYAAIVKYGAISAYREAFPSQTDPGPADRGDNFFAGGYFSSYIPTTIRQQVKLSTDWLEATDADNVQFELEGWFGGRLNEYDAAYVSVEFQDANGNKLGLANTSEVFPSDRNNKTGLVRRAAKGDFPQGTRSVQVELHMFNYYGYLSNYYNDGYADNLSLKLKEKK